MKENGKSDSLASGMGDWYLLGFDAGLKEGKLSGAYSTSDVIRGHIDELVNELMEKLVEGELSLTDQVRLTTLRELSAWINDGLSRANQ